MASWKSAFGSFLKTEDLQGRSIPVTIETIGIEDVKGEHGIEKKLVARFTGKEKGLILNQTNCEMLEQITGTDDYDYWVGHRVFLYPTTTKFGNKTVPCLRIKQAGAPPAPPQPVAPQPNPVPVENELTDDDIPF